MTDTQTTQPIPSRRGLLWILRMLLIGLWFTFATPAFLLVALVHRKSSANNKRFIQLIVPVSRRILGVKVISLGGERIDPKPCIYLMNHQSFFDLLTNLDIYPEHCVVIIKKSLAAVPVFGWILKLGDNVFLDRSNREGSINKLNDALDNLREKQHSVWIFPEGTRNPSGMIGPFKKGPFYLAAQARLPLVPVVTSTFWKTLDFNKWRAGIVLIEKLPPFATPDASTDLDKLSVDFRNHMIEQVERLNLEAIRLSKRV